MCAFSLAFMVRAPLGRRILLLDVNVRKALVDRLPGLYAYSSEVNGGV